MFEKFNFQKKKTANANALVKNYRGCKEFEPPLESLEKMRQPLLAITISHKKYLYTLLW